MEIILELLSEHGLSVAFNVLFVVGLYMLVKYVIREKAEAFEESHNRNYQIICDLIKKLNGVKDDLTEVKSDLKVIIEIFKDRK